MKCSPQVVATIATSPTVCDIGRRTSASPRWRSSLRKHGSDSRGIQIPDCPEAESASVKIEPRLGSAPISARPAGKQHRTVTATLIPQSNDKFERLHKTLKTTIFRRRAPRTLDEAVSMVTTFVVHCNERNLRSAIEFIAHDEPAWREARILSLRDWGLEAARKRWRFLRTELEKSDGSRRPDYTLQRLTESRCG